MGASDNTNCGIHSMESHQDNIINVSSDLEEGEIHDASDLDDISDVSTEEEVLLRQRIKILENYNSALGKKEAKERCFQKDKKNRVSNSHQTSISIPSNLIVIDDLEDEIPYASFKDKKVKSKSPRRRKKPQKRRSISSIKVKKKPKNVVICDVQSSSDSEQENLTRHKRILREAIGISKKNIDSSSLKRRLLHFMKGSSIISPKSDKELKGVDNSDMQLDPVNSDLHLAVDFQIDKSGPACHPNVLSFDSKNNQINDSSVKGSDTLHNNLLCQQNGEHLLSKDQTGDLNISLTTKNCTSDDEAETLRQLALNSKSAKHNTNSSASRVQVQPPCLADTKAEDSTDSDTTELRLIALKSAMLKKAMERKKLHKRNLRRKRKSASVLFSDDDLANADIGYLSKDNNTDIETVDMETIKEPCKSPISEIDIPNTLDNFNQPADLLSDPTNVPPRLSVNYHAFNENAIQDNYYDCLFNENQYYDSNNYIHKPMKKNDSFPVQISSRPQEVHVEEDEAEDEDMLRALVLNSLSKNNSKQTEVIPEPVLESTTLVESEVKALDSTTLPDSGLIIKLGESDSGSECEITKNLAEMHHRQKDFQINLDLFLKSARSKVEHSAPLPETPLSNPVSKKLTPMAVKHLPKADQLEYRQLVKRMSELERMRSSRQLAQQQAPQPEEGHSEHTPTQNLTVDLQYLPKSNKLTSGRSFQIVKNLTAPSSMEIQLELSKKKISNQKKILEHLEVEGRVLRQKADSLIAQQRSINSALKATRLGLSQHQRICNTAQLTLLKHKKRHDILINRIKFAPKSKISNLAITIKQNVNPVFSSNKIKNVKLLQNGALITQNYQNSLSSNYVPKSNSLIPLHQHNGIGLMPDSLLPIETLLNPKKPEELNKIDISQSQIDGPKLNNSSPSLSKRRKVQDNENLICNLNEHSQHGEPQISPSERCIQNSNNVNRNDSSSQVTNLRLQMCVDSLETTEAKECIADIKASIGELSNPMSCEMTNNTPHSSIDSGFISATEAPSTEVLGEIIEKTSIKSTNVDSNSEPRCVSNSVESPVVVAASNQKCSDASHQEYKSPLYVLKTKNNWTENPQSIFCPFEVGGSCKDPECRYIHPKPSDTQ